MDIPALVRAQRTWFQTGATLPIEARQTALDRLRRSAYCQQEAEYG